MDGRPAPPPAPGCCTTFFCTTGTHPRRALENAQRLFSLTDREKNIILRHMWPLTVTPPKYREAYVIVMFDKYCSLMETFHKPVMELMEYQELTADLKKGFAAQ